MNLNIEIPDALGPALKAKAKEQGITEACFARQVLERELSPSGVAKPRKSAFGLLAEYGPGPSADEIDESRREMLQGFAEEIP